MSRNPNFERALACLGHPVSLAAAGTLLLNALWLEPYHPSWFSGKVGDLAWMIIGPLVLAALLAWLIPHRGRNEGRWVGLASLLLLALGYALVKAWSPANTLVRSLGDRAGVPLKLALDATDLLCCRAFWLLMRFGSMCRCTGDQGARCDGPLSACARSR